MNPTPPNPHVPARPRLPRSVIAFGSLLLLMAGAQCWLFLGQAQWPANRHLLIIAAAAIAGLCIAILRPARRPALAFIEAVRRPSPVARRLVAVMLAALSGLYLYSTACSQGRPFAPVIHDEHAYLIQSRMLAVGKLWMPPHPQADFFESFHLITDRVYAPKYSPGAALFYAPGLAVGMPHWLPPLLLTAAAIGLAYLVLTELVDGLAGLIGALMLPGLELLRRISIEALSQAPMLFLAMLALWAFLHWRKNRSLGWMVALGIAIGWGAITRPVDALSIALPVALAVVFELRCSREPRWRTTLIVGLLAVFPFLTLQLICNKGITGSYASLPWNAYAERYDPYDTMKSLPLAPMRVPASTLPQKRRFAAEFTVEMYKVNKGQGLIKRLIHSRLAPTLETALPSLLLLILLPLGVVGALCRRISAESPARWVIPAALGIFVVLYARYTFFLAHYAVAIAPLCIGLIMIGWQTLAAGLPRAADGIRIVGAAALLAFALTSYPQLHCQWPGDEWEQAPAVRRINQRLAALPQTPAVVLFRFDAQNGNPHVEPVYNVDSALIDDAKVIRAHDLGDTRNREIFKYYAAKSPSRAFYLYDRAKDPDGQPLKYLGTARELAR